MIKSLPSANPKPSPASCPADHPNANSGQPFLPLLPLMPFDATKPEMDQS